MSTPSLRIATLALLAGCADPWGDARAACELEDAAPMDWALNYAAEDGGLNGLSVSTACAEALLAPFGGDPLGMVAELGGNPDLGAHIEEARLRARPLDGVVLLVWGLFGLVAADFGRVGEMEASAYVSQTWVDRFTEDAEALGLGAGDPLGHVLYSTAASRTATLSWMPDDAPAEAGMGMMRWPADSLHLLRELDVDAPWAFTPWAPLTAGALVVHEAQHASIDGLQHVECDPPDPARGRSCDADLEGAYGATFATLWFAAQAARGGEACALAEWPHAYAMTHDAEDQIRLTWTELVMTELPDSPLDACR